MTTIENKTTYQAPRAEEYVFESPICQMVNTSSGGFSREGEITNYDDDSD